MSLLMEWLRSKPRATQIWIMIVMGSISLGSLAYAVIWALGKYF